MNIEKVLIADDESLIREFLAETLRRKHMEVTTVENGQKAIALLKSQHFDLLITDMKMPDLTGLDVLKKAKELYPEILVIVVTGHSSIENAVEAMRLGALNYLLKPCCPETIEALIDKANKHLHLIAENHYLRQRVFSGDKHLPHQVIGESAILKKILQDAIKVAQSNASVFISGESGTGKEVIAQVIHDHSSRKNKPFIKVNCAALPETLIESEFFGHEKGSFTGANSKRAGRFELANSGTLLLDEITEIPLSLQAKLLRVVQEQEFERVGGNKPIGIDVRFISTSNRDMKEAIAAKIFREDLYYRLNVVPIHLPPLRERLDDILALAEYFVKNFSLKNRCEQKELSKGAQKKLLAYNWPGNVRELSNIIERAVVMDPDRIIGAEHLNLDIKSGGIAKASLLVGMSLEEMEKKLIVETLQLHQDDRNKAAKTLGISPRKLLSKLNSYDIVKSKKDL